MQDMLADRGQIAGPSTATSPGCTEAGGADIEASLHPDETITVYRGDSGELVEMNYKRFGA